MKSSGTIVGGVPVETFNDECWQRLRAKDSVPEDFLADPADIGPFRSSGGKGGDQMAFSKDSRYIIKELNQGDHVSLDRITPSYVERVIGDKTLLCTFYLHYKESSTGRLFVVMRNLLPQKGPYLGLYDLKGCADDRTLEASGRKVRAVRKRVWNVHMWCGDCTWSDERMTYYQGKVAARMLQVQLTDAQRERVLSHLKLDTDWLAESGLMDYSLLVGLRRLTQKEFETDPIVLKARQARPGELIQPLLHIAPNEEVMLVYIGIIDFLQEWTLPKKIAMCLKFMERNKATIPPAPYGKRFYQHFSRSIKGGAQPLINGTSNDPAEFKRLNSLASYFSCKSFSEVDNELDALARGAGTSKEEAERDPKSRPRGGEGGCFSGLCFSGLRRKGRE